MKNIYRRSYTRVFAAILSIVLAGSQCIWAGEVGRVTYVEGRVDVLRTGSAMAMPLVEGESISVGDAIRTKSNSKVEVTFNDKSVTRLAQNSRVEVKEYLLDNNNRRRSASLMLDRGKARTIIAKMPDAAPFVISTPNANGEVKGSDIFTFYQAGNSGMLVAEGRLSIANIAHPGEKVVIPAGNSVLVPLEELPKGPREYFELEKKLNEQDTGIPISAQRKEKLSVIRGAISQLTGKVRVRAKDSGAFHDAKIGEILGEGDKIETGDDGVIEVRFDNGNAINLKPNTRIILVKLVIDPKTGEYDNLLEVEIGKMRARIENLKGGSSFKVKTPTAISGARGTIMYVDVSQTSTTSFFEGGDGFITSTVSGQTQDIGAGQNSAADISGNISTPVVTTGEDRMNFGEGWNAGNGTEGYSAPEGTTGAYLYGSDTGTGATGGDAGGNTGGVTGGGTNEGTGGEVPFTETPFNPITPPAPTTPIFALGSFETTGNDIDFTAREYFWRGGQTVEATAAGQFSNPNGYSLWKGDLETSLDGIKILGLVGGIDVDNSLEGLGYAIYVTPDREIGYIRLSDGSVMTGTFDPALGTFQAGGSFTACYKGTTSILPEDLYYGNSDTLHIDDIASGRISGPTFSGSLTGGKSVGVSTELQEQDWSIWRTDFSGTYSSAPSANYEAIIGGFERKELDDGDIPWDGYYIVRMNGTQWADGKLSGLISGRGLSFDRTGYMAMDDLSTIQGEYIGTYGDGKWQSVGAGVSTSELLQFGGPMEDLSGSFGHFGSYDIASGRMVWDIASHITGLIGGLGLEGSVWKSQSDIVIIGEYSDPIGLKLWGTDLNGYTKDGARYIGMAVGSDVNNKLKGLAYAFYIRPDGDIYRAGILRSTDISGDFYPWIGMFEADGTMASSLDLITKIKPDELGSNIQQVSSNSGLISGAAFSGVINGASFSIEDMDFSIWKCGSGGEYTYLPDTDWKADIGGSSKDVDTGMVDSYWIGSISGSAWEGNEFFGNIAGTMLSYGRMGSFSGECIGVYSNGRWEAENIGTETSGAILEFNGKWGEEDTGLYYNAGGQILPAGEILGIMGNTFSPWGGGSRAYIAMGEYRDDTGMGESGACIWNVPVQSYNRELDNDTTVDGGAFSGFTAGVLFNGKMYGSTAAIYTDKFGEGGYFTGALSGDYFTGIDMWRAQGLSVMKGISGLSMAPDELVASVHNSPLSANVLGNFGIPGAEGSYISGSGDSSATYYLNNQSWGIYNMRLGGTESYGNAFHNPNGDKVWTATIDGEGTFGTVYSKGLMKGDVFGTYDYEGEDWVATGVGTWHSREESPSPDGEYHGFMGGVWDGDVLIGRMVAVYGGALGSGCEFAGAGLAGFNDIGGMTVNAVNGIDPDIHNAESCAVGIWKAGINGAYDSSPASPFKLTIGGEATEGYWIGIIGAIKRPDSDVILGAYRGVLLDMSTPEQPDLDTNLYSGDIIGILTGTDTWQAVGLGEWDSMWMGDDAPGDYPDLNPGNLEEFLSASLVIEEQAGIGEGFFGHTINNGPGNSLGNFAVNSSSIKLKYQDWGIYYSTSEGSYTNSAGQTTWLGTSGGGSLANGAYWISHAGGTWDGGEIMGFATGHTISDGSIGTTEGDIYGTFDEATGTWSMIEVGSWVDDPLSYHGELVGNFGYYGTAPDDLQNKVRLDYGSISALFGGVGDPWGPDASSLTVIGEYQGADDFRLWGNFNVNATTADGVQLKGMMAGTKAGSILKGLFLAIYVRSDGMDGYKAGYIASADLSGHFYGFGMFEAQGNTDTYLDIDVGADHAIVQDSEGICGTIAGDVSGTMEALGWHVEGHGDEWSIWRNSCGGPLSGGSPSSDNWHSVATGSNEWHSETWNTFEVFATSVLGDKWSGNELSAKMAGLSVVAEKDGTNPWEYRIDLHEGYMIGTYDDTGSLPYWQATGIGMGMEISLAESLRADGITISGIDGDLFIGAMTGDGAGEFGDTGTMSVDSLSGKTVNFTGEQEGVWGAIGSGSYNYSSTPAPGSFAWQTTVKGDFVSDGSYWLGAMSGTASDTPDLSDSLKLEGAVKGIYLQLCDDGTISAGKVLGSVKGEYIEVNEAGGTWHTAAAGEWVEAESMLNNMPDIASTVATLSAAVNVPITEVYSSVMSGAGTGGITSATMNVGLYAISPAALDGIWAAIISGQYAAAPTTDWTVTVSNGDNNATLSGGAWDAINNQWTANVTGTVGGNIINGQAAGTYGDGTFKGAATGTFEAAT